MENIKLIMCDVDGTLILNNTCAPLNFEGIKYARSKGIAFGIATGRPYCIFPENLKRWGLENYCDYIVCSNGSQIVDLIHNTQAQQYYLNQQVMSDIIDRYKNNPKVTVCLYSDDGKAQVGNRITEAYVTKCTNFSLKQEIVDLKQYIDHDYSKLLLLCDNETQKQVIADYKQNPSSDYDLTPSSTIIIEVTAPGLSKVKGIDKVCEILNITKDQVLCFGDEMNDYEMLKTYNGVAMDNAVDAIKQICHYHTINCSDGGVGDFILKNL